MKSKLVLIMFLIVTLLSTTVLATEPTTSEGTDAQLLTSENQSADVTATQEETATGETTQEGDSTEAQIENSELHFYGDDIVIDKLVDGNVSAVGKKVTVTGEMVGDLVVIADEVTIDGAVVYGDAFIVAQKFKVEKAEIRGMLYTVASQIELDGVAYDMYAVADKLDIQFYGSVLRDLRVMATEVSIDGIVKRQAYIETDKLFLDKNCELADLIYKAKEQAKHQPKEGDETTEIPSTVVSGANDFTQVKKKVLNTKISNVVKNILNDANIKNVKSEKDVVNSILSLVFGAFNISTNSETVTNAKTGITIPYPVFIIEIVVIVVLAAGLILPLILKKKETKVNTTPSKE